jgi:hypothetical protein
MSNLTNLEKIHNYLNVIKKSPSKGVRYFFMEPDGLQFIVSGDKLNLLPNNLQRLKLKDEFWLHIDADNKKVLYYAYDIGSYAMAEDANTEAGEYSWDELEQVIYGFLVVNLDDLTRTAFPHTVSGGTSALPDAHKRVSETTYQKPSIANDYGRGAFGGVSSSSHNYFGTPEYKAREAFFDKMEALRKQNRTSAALDYATTAIDELCKENRLSELDRWLDLINLDKLNTITMLGILRQTKGIEIKSRGSFLTKVSNHLTKIKPSRAANLLKDLQ